MDSLFGKLFVHGSVPFFVEIVRSDHNINDDNINDDVVKFATVVGVIWGSCGEIGMEILGKEGPLYAFFTPTQTRRQSMERKEIESTTSVEIFTGGEQGGEPCGDQKHVSYQLSFGFRL